MSTRKFWTVNSLMIAALLVWLCGLQLWAQDRVRHDKYRDDPGAYCMAGPPEAGNTHAHECHCKMVCGPDVNGEMHRVEASDCEEFCEIDRCLCHADEGCKMTEIH